MYPKQKYGEVDRADDLRNVKIKSKEFSSTHCTSGQAGVKKKSSNVDILIWPLKGAFDTFAHCRLFIHFPQSLLTVHYFSYCRDAFAIFDRDKDGYVDIKELMKCASMMGFMLEVEELREEMSACDQVIPRINGFSFALNALL